MSETTQAPSWSITFEPEHAVQALPGHIPVWVRLRGEVNPKDVRFRYAWRYVSDQANPEEGDSGPDWVDYMPWGFRPEHTGSFDLFAEALDTSTGEVRKAGCRVRFVRGDDSTRADATPLGQGDVVIRADDVSMIFNIASEQFNSLKEYFIALMRHELHFKEFRALDHISFEVRRGEAFGLVGTNGSGKSTMLKIIAGVLDPSEGDIKVTGTIAPLIELGAGFDMELTAKENIYLNGALLGYRREFIDEKYDEIVRFAELENFMDMPLKNYSSGMVARIAFAIATITEPDILIVDETLSVGDQFFQEKCERRIRELIDSNNVTVLLVSHSIDLVERVCDRVCWIEKGKQKMLGPVNKVIEAYKAYGTETEEAANAGAESAEVSAAASETGE